MPADETREEHQKQEQGDKGDENRQRENERKRENGRKSVQEEKLHLKDYVALIIAALQTIFLPLLFLIGLLVVIAIIIRILL